MNCDHIEQTDKPCDHEELAFSSPTCQRVICLDCKKEWGELPIVKSPWQPEVSTTPEIAGGQR